MKVVILGAGAMGCLYASYLSRNKNTDLLLIDHNPDKIAEINRDGLVMEEKGRKIKIPAKAAMSGTVPGPTDVLMIFVKAHQTYGALKENADLIGKNTTVLTLQNGMGNYLEIGKFVAIDQIVIGTSNHNSTIRGYGKFLHAADGKTIIGSFSKDNSRVKLVQGLFAGTGMDISTSPDLRKLIWRKLLVNMSINPLTMLLEVKNGFVQADKSCWDCAEMIINEGLEVAKADGVDFDREEIFELIRKICQVTRNGCSSMLQDRMHKRMTEIDFINGTVVKLARKYKIAVPYNTLIVKMVRAVEDSFVDPEA